MRVALTGTPGTGKTFVSKYLRGMGHTVIDLNRFARRNKYIHNDVMDIRSVDRAIRRKYTGEIIIESHISHLMSVDIAVVLRCEPDVLEKRLRRKGWHIKKIRDNIIAEAIDLILVESMERLGEKVMEIDTTSSSPDKVARRIHGILCGNMKLKSFKKSLKYGNIDWSWCILKNPEKYR